MENPANIQQFSPHSFNNIPNHFINWTMSYRTDADVFHPYVRNKALKEASRAGPKFVDSMISRKDRLAVSTQKLNYSHARASAEKFPGKATEKNMTKKSTIKSLSLLKIQGGLPSAADAHFLTLNAIFLKFK